MGKAMKRGSGKAPALNRRDEMRRNLKKKAMSKQADQFSEMCSGNHESGEQYIKRLKKIEFRRIIQAKIEDEQEKKRIAKVNTTLRNPISRGVYSDNITCI